MSRADTPTDERVPFNLYVDEFQHFATDSFATILSEARKYALNLTVANQYIAQMSGDVKDAVFGNVGSMVAFRMGADDARSMQRYFEPKFSEYDLVHMHNRHAVINMTIDGEKSPAFSAITLDLPPLSVDVSKNIIKSSRNKFATDRMVAAPDIDFRYNDSTGQKRTQAKKPKETPPFKVPSPRTSTPQPENRHVSFTKSTNLGHAIVASQVFKKPRRGGQRHRKNLARHNSLTSDKEILIYKQTRPNGQKSN
jgi:hypothetical protein